MQKMQSHHGTEKGGKSSGGAPKGTGMGQRSQQMNPSSGNQQTKPSGRDPGQNTGNLSVKHGEGESRQGACTMKQLKGGY